MTDNNEPRKEGNKDNKDFINIKCVSQDGATTPMQEIFFRVKLNTAMKKVMKSYSDRVGTPESSLRFLFDGRRILDDQTPKQLNLEDDDIIEVYQEQTGGQ